MEAAKIEWSSIESVFVIDEAYEDINAPQWVDFLTSSQSHPPDDDDAWFCRPECKHPKTADDFLKLKSTPTSKLLRSVIGLTDWTPNTNRQPILKRRGVAPNINQVEDTENHNPNHSHPTPLPPPHNRHFNDDNIDFQPAKDLFGGGDILAKITDLGTKLKKMASLTISNDSTHQHPSLKNKLQPTSVSPLSSNDSTHQHPPLKNKPPPTSVSALSSKDRPVLAQRPDFILKEKKPFAIKDTCPSSPLNSSPYHNRTNRIGDDAENVPISLQCHQHQSLLPIRTNPPTPQGFSATRDPTSSTPSKGPKSRLMKREVLQEKDQDGTLRAELDEKCHTQNESLITGKQGRGLDVLWFLKPCTL